jgi:hypothetical protein
MINPYRAPLETRAEVESVGSVVADFRLTERQIRFAESKFMLNRYGGRLTLLSLAMIALALFVGLGWDWPHPRPIEGTRFLISILIRELGVMALATFLYLRMIRDARRKVVVELDRHGIVDGAAVAVTTTEGSFQWTTSAGTFQCPIGRLQLVKTAKGVVVVVDTDLFVPIPKHSDFGGASYRDLLRSLKHAN